MKIKVIITLIFFVACFCVYADPPEGRGRGHNQGNAYGRTGQRNGNNHTRRNGNSRTNSAEVHRRNFVQAEARAREREIAFIPEGNQEEDYTTTSRSRTRNAYGLHNEHSRGGVSEDVLLASLVRLEDSLNSLRAQEHARWNYNPRDDRSQGNSGKPDMRDPYGFSKDNRLEETGNRGRPIRNREENMTYTATDYIYVDFYTYWAAYLDELGYSSRWLNFESLGYSEEEIAFLQSLSLQEIYEGMLTGYVAGPSQELPLLSTEQGGIDLGNIINYADAYQFVYMPGDTVEYEISLTNPYDTELTLSVMATIEYMDNAWVYNPEVGTYQRRHLVGTAVEGESTEEWETVTIAPGETITLYDTYYMPLDAYWSNYQIDVTLVDVSSGTSYNDPCAGWFDPPLNLAEAHRNNNKK